MAERRPLMAEPERLGPRPWRRLLAATLGGSLTGLGVALLVHLAISTTATPLPPARAFWQAALLALAGGLSGLALSAVISLRAASGEAAYRRPRR